MRAQQVLLRLNKTHSAHLSRLHRDSSPDDSANVASSFQKIVNSFFPFFNSLVPVKKIKSFKETKWTVNTEMRLFFFLPPSSQNSVHGLHISPFHLLMNLEPNQNLRPENLAVRSPMLTSFF
jgi:hypothetical protein